MQQKNFLLFLVLSFLLLIGWIELRRQFAPQRPNNAVPEKPEEQPATAAAGVEGQDAPAGPGADRQLDQGRGAAGAEARGVAFPASDNGLRQASASANLTAPRNSICTCTSTPAGLG